MVQSIRVLYRDVQGQARQNFNWTPIKAASAVVVTATEWRFAGGVLGSSGRTHLGDDKVYVTNIGTHDDEGGGSGGVEFLLHAETGSPIDVAVTISVLGDVEDVVSA